MNRLALLVCSLTLLGSCRALQDALHSFFRQPSFTFRGVNLADATLGGLTLDTIWALDNPNDIGLSLASVDYALFIDDKQVVAGTPPQGLTVAPRGSTELHFPAAIRFSDLASVIETFLTRDTAQYRVEGAVGVQTPLGVLRLPMATSGTFEVPKLPQVAFGSPRLAAASLTQLTIQFPISVRNRNTYPLPIGEIAGALSVGGASVGTLSTPNLGLLQGGATHEVTVPLTVNLLSAGAAAVNAARGRPAALRFDARLNSGTHSLPLQLEQVVSFVP